MDEIAAIETTDIVVILFNPDLQFTRFETLRFCLCLIHSFICQTHESFTINTIFEFGGTQAQRQTCWSRIFEGLFDSIANKQRCQFISFGENDNKLIAPISKHTVDMFSNR